MSESERPLPDWTTPGYPGDPNPSIFAEIQRALECLLDGGFSLLFFTPKDRLGRNYYVQCALQEEGLIVEAVSNEYLEAENRLTPGQVSMLEKWYGKAEPGENYAQSFPVPVPTEFVAGLILLTLTWIHGLRDKDDLMVEFGADVLPAGGGLAEKINWHDRE